MRDSDECRSGTHQQKNFVARFFGIRWLLLTGSIAGLLVTNVASLVSASVHDSLHNALWRVLSMGGQAFADDVLRNSPRVQLDGKVKTKTIDLETRNTHLTKTNLAQAKQLDEMSIKNKQLVHQLDVNGKQAKATVSAVHRRLAKGVSRNVAALPSESIPYLGIGVTLAVTSLDIYDACQTMNDFNTLLRMMGQGEEKPDLCGQKMPTVNEVLVSAKSEWRTSVQRVADEARSFKVQMPEVPIEIPEVRLPTLAEARKGVCPVVLLPYLCVER